MLIHPLLLYIGYVGFSVPFAFAMAALITGRLSEEWLTITRRWTVVAWLFLTGGIIYGGWWSYHTLGWGGYWAWDPVENASFSSPSDGSPTGRTSSGGTASWTPWSPERAPSS